MKQKLSITLEEAMVERLDEMIDRKAVKSRSHAIEKIVGERFDDHVTKAVVLCGGEGTRLRPITYEIPKPMVPIRGRPILEYIMESLRASGIKEVVLAVGYKHEKIISHFGEKWGGVDIKYTIEKKPLGTGKCLHLARDELNETFFMINGDVLCRADLKDMLAFHRKEECMATIALTSVKDTKGYGVVVMKGGKIVNFVEKPKVAPTNLINAGVYLFEPSIFDYLPDKTFFMIEEVFTRLAREGNLAGYVYDGKWFDVGTPERYEMAIKGWG